MGRRSHARRLSVWMNGAFVGTWEISAQGHELRYAPAWIASPQGRPLSLSLPFTPENRPHKGLAVHAYFENLLPDSQPILSRLARRYQAASLGAFDLLAQIGRDCVGALQILPEGEVPTDIQRIDAVPLDEAAVARLLRLTLQPAQLDIDGEDFRIAIAGAQEKTALLWHAGQWWLPRGTTPTTHILKLPMGLAGNMRLDLSESVENEWLCAQILQAYGLPVASCHPLVFEGQKVLGVERFDRRWSDDGRWVIRLPQEDMCQATGTPPHLKYEAEGGPGVDRIMALLDGSLQRERDRLVFFRAQVLFWMLCAPDGHAKNFSLALRAGGAYEMTPLYDVMSAYPFLSEGSGRLSPHKVRLAMAVRSKNPQWKMRDVTRQHWMESGRRHGMITDEGRGTAVLDELVASTPHVVQSVRARLPADFPVTLAESILGGLELAARKLTAKA